MKKMMIVSIMAVLAVAGNALGLELNQVKIHGFISQGYLISDKYDFIYADTESGTFQFNEMGISFSTELTDNLRLGIQLLSRDLGDIGNNKVTVDWALADYRYRNWLGFRFGKMKKPYGLYNQIRDIDAARANIFLPLDIYDPVSRETYLVTQGVGIYGSLPGGISYEAQYGTPDMDIDSGVVQNAKWLLGINITGVEVNSTSSFAIQWSPIQGLTLGGSVFDLSWSADTSVGKLDVEKLRPYVASLEYMHKDFKIACEYRYYENVAKVNGKTSVDTAMENYYLQAGYHFTNWFELASYYSIFYSDKEDKDGERYTKRGQSAANAWRKDFAVSARFDINDYWVFKIEGHYMNGLIQVTTTDKDPSENWFLFAAKMTFSF